MNKNTKSKLKFLVLVLTVGAIIGYYFFYKKSDAMPNMAPAEVEVNAITIHTKKVQLTAELPGRVAAYKISEVRPQVDGIVTKINFEEGSYVKKGKPLYQINPAVYEAAYERAKANLKATQAKKNRYHDLLKFEAISKQEYDDILFTLADAKSQFSTAKNNLDYSRVLAPISGYIGKTNVTEGAIVSSSGAVILTTITELNPVYVDIVQPTKDSIRLGNQKSIDVSLTIDGMPYDEKGKLQFSEVFADETTDSIRIRAKFSNENKKLLPGMFVSAKLHLKAVKAILVPQKATSRMPDGSLMIFVIENNVAKMRQIKADQTFEDNWVVSEGLSDGEVVICEGTQKIADGVKVKPVFVDKADPAQANEEAEKNEITTK